MILKALTLENFKGIREPMRIEFAPLTLLFGPNNAGKSTIVQALMYAHEVLERKNADARQTQLGGEVVDLGGFQNLVYDHDLSRSIRMRFELDLRPSGLPDRFNSIFESPFRERDLVKPLIKRDMTRLSHARASLTDIWVELEIACIQPSSSRSTMLPFVRQYSVGTGDNRYAALSFGFNNNPYLDFLNFGIPQFRKSISVDFNEPVFEAERSESWLYDQLSDVMYHIQPWEICKSGDLLDTFPPLKKVSQDVLLDWTQRLEFVDHPSHPIWKSDFMKSGEFITRMEYLLNFLDSIIVEPGRILLEKLQESIYLGPFRKLPSRHYRLSNAAGVPDWASGQAAWDQLAKKDSQSLVDSVNEWILEKERFNTGYRIEVERFKKLDVNSSFWQALLNDDLTEKDASILRSIQQELAKLPEENNKLNFINVASGVALAPQDLGTGISQLLPVIVAALSNVSGIVAIEEPESNIHPAFQVILGDLFLSQAKTNPNRLFLVETHSEHLVLRIMRRMRETYQGKQRGDLAASPLDVSILYVERDGERTVARSMPLNALGELVKAWPGGFFEEGLREQFGDD